MHLDAILSSFWQRFIFTSTSFRFIFGAGREQGARDEESRSRCVGTIRGGVVLLSRIEMPVRVQERPPPPRRIHAHRATRGGRHYRGARRDVVARAAEGPRPGETVEVYE